MSNGAHSHLEDDLSPCRGKIAVEGGGSQERVVAMCHLSRQQTVPKAVGRIGQPTVALHLQDPKFGQELADLDEHSGPQLLRRE